MKFKKWMIIFICFALLTGTVVGLFNVAADPFGVFGDRIMNWYAYDMTNNPRASKIAYLDMHHKEYDSYLIGCSKTSSIPTDKLNEYYGGARFYNMLMYGGDMYDISKTAEYVIENYEVRNIVLNIGLEEAARFNQTGHDIKDTLHAKVKGTSALSFYGRYFFANPEYSFKKIAAYFKRSYFPSVNDVFVPENGMYNKVHRDIEAIGNMGEYLAHNPGFDEEMGMVYMSDMDQSVEAISGIKKLCEEKGITFMLMASPVYYKEVFLYPEEQLREYWRKIANVTDFWDFSGYSPIGADPRYFYDIYHFRNVVGEMMLARVFGDEKAYVPEGFGHYTTKENVDGYAEKIFDPGAKRYAEEDEKDEELNEYTKKLPILMYHNIDTDESKQDGETVTPEKFRADMLILKKNGYTTVTFKDIEDYVLYGKDIPESPVIIIFDDGYYSNYEYAYPILKELGMKAAISVIGMSMGKDYYKEDTSLPITPHFGYAEAKEMYDSGVIDIQSHSYAMHDYPPYEKDGGRDGVYMKPGESEKDYIRTFDEDFQKSKAGIEDHVGNSVFVYAYPFGKRTMLTESLLKRTGVSITLTTDPGVNTLVKGLPQSLTQLKRINAGADVSSEELLSSLN